MNFALRIAALGLLVGTFSACTGDKPPTNVSEKPEVTTTSISETVPHKSVLAIRARIKFDDFAALIRQELPKTINGDGTERTCKRVIGIKICGTAQWQYQINRSDNLTVSGDKNKIALQIPLDFNGVAGIQGDVADALNLSNLKFNGALIATLNLGLDLDKNWCPVIETDIDYVWTLAPRVKWSGGLELDVQHHLDKAIVKQLAELQPRLADAIDCNQFRDTLQAYWRSYSFPLDLSENDTMHLNVQPVGFAFSGVHTEPEKLGITFSLMANTVLESQAIEVISMELPEVQRTDYNPGITEFELLIRADYSQLQTLAAPELIGKVMTSDTSAGQVTVRVNSLDISGNINGITLAIAFDADLPITRRNTPGTVFLTAVPYIDRDKNQIRLSDISISPVLDSALWNLLTNVFENEIIRAIQEKAVLDLTPNIENLEERLINQLRRHASNSALDISAKDLSISVTRLTPERDALTVIMQTDVQLDIDVPLSALSSSH